MDTGLDIRTAQALCARLLHDLAGPIGGVHTGAELLEDLDSGLEADATRLIADSARQAMARLRLLRIAYGLAGETVPGDATEARALVEAWLAGSRVGIDWPDDRVLAPLVDRRGGVKLLLNLVIIARQALVRPGRLVIDGSPRPPGGAVTVVAAGPGAGMSGRALALLTEPDGAVATGPRGNDPAETLAADQECLVCEVAGRFAAHYGFMIAAFAGERDFLELTLSW